MYKKVLTNKEIVFGKYLSTGRKAGIVKQILEEIMQKNPPSISAYKTIIKVSINKLQVLAKKCSEEKGTLENIKKEINKIIVKTSKIAAKSPIFEKIKKKLIVSPKGKGGVGNSFIISNILYNLSINRGKRILGIDLDVTREMGNLERNLDPYLSQINTKIQHVEDLLYDFEDYVRSDNEKLLNLFRFHAQYEGDSKIRSDDEANLYLVFLRIFGLFLKEIDQYDLIIVDIGAGEDTKETFWSNLVINHLCVTNYGSKERNVLINLHKKIQKSFHKYILVLTAINSYGGKKYYDETIPPKFKNDFIKSLKIKDIDKQILGLFKIPYSPLAGTADAHTTLVAKSRPTPIVFAPKYIKEAKGVALELNRLAEAITQVPERNKEK